jgi:uncharacterized protein YndB with AHSA1/START domain
MDTIQLTREPVTTTGMLIRRPAEDVFDAFVNPDVTTKFWFNRSEGRLELGKPVKWHWDMYGISVQVIAKAIEPYARLVVEWTGHTAPTTIQWDFIPVADGTFVAIRNYGFTGTADERVEHAIDAAQGFSFVLAGLKAFLEHGIQLNLIHDRHPQGVGAH